jgi:hypothetical protein
MAMAAAVEGQKLDIAFIAQGGGNQLLVVGLDVESEPRRCSLSSQAIGTEVQLRPSSKWGIAAATIDRTSYRPAEVGVGRCQNSQLAINHGVAIRETGHHYWRGAG